MIFNHEYIKRTEQVAVSSDHVRVALSRALYSSRSLYLPSSCSIESNFLPNVFEMYVKGIWNWDIELTKSHASEFWTIEVLLPLVILELYVEFNQL